MLDLGLAAILIFVMLTYFEIAELRRSVVRMQAHYDTIIDEHFTGKPRRRRVEYVEAPSESDVAIPREEAKTTAHIGARFPSGFTMIGDWRELTCTCCRASFRPKWTSPNDRRVSATGWAHSHRKECKL